MPHELQSLFYTILQNFAKSSLGVKNVAQQNFYVHCVILSLEFRSWIVFNLPVMLLISDTSKAISICWNFT